MRAVPVGSPAADAPEHPEAGLVGAVARGDRAAFETLYDTHAPVVHGTALRVLRDPSLAEEVTQEVFVEAWRTAARFDPTLGTARSWLVVMARRRAVDRVRSVQAARDRDDRAAWETPPAYDHVAESVELRLEQQAVRHCLGSLTDLQRQAIDLAFFGGRTHRELATELATPLGTVKARLRDGLRRLRSCLEGTR